MVEPARLLIPSGRLHRIVCRLLRIPESESTFHVADYGSISAAGDKLLLDRSAGFVLLHLPIPHPGGIYNRRTGQLTTGPSTYIDNLALADRYLAHVHSILQESGEWDSSTVFVMGDHGWRTTLLWKGLPGWTEEEERASQGGKFDTRPAYIVKLAGQQNGVRIESPFRATETRSLMDALISQKIRSPEELLAWVQKVAGTEPLQAQARCGSSSASPGLPCPR